MDYFQALNYFFQFAQFKNLPAPARLTYLGILHKWNGFRRETSFSLTDRELSELTGLRIGRPITEAKRLLKNVGLIDFKSNNKGTTYVIRDRSVAQHSGGNVTHTDAKTTCDGDISNPTETNQIKERRKKKAREGGKNLIF